MGPSEVVVEGLQCLAHAWWIDTLLYLLVCAAVIKYALPLARGVMMCYRIANSIMDMLALQTALKTAKPVVPAAPPGPLTTRQPIDVSSLGDKGEGRGVMRRPVVKPFGAE